MDSDSLTVLTSPSGIQCGCKVLDTDWNVLQPYAPAKKFTRSEITAETLDELKTQLEVLMQRRDSFLVYGAPTDVWPEGEAALRRSRSKPGEPATLTADRETQWLILDVDKVPDLHAMLKSVGLRGCEHIGIYSSSDRGEGDESCRVFFRLDRPYPLAQLQAWAKSLSPECCIDPKIYEPQQPIYVCAPVFMDGDRDVGDLLEARLFVGSGEPFTLPYVNVAESTAAPVDVGEMLAESTWGEAFFSVLAKCEVLGPLQDGKIPVRCPWEGDHTSESGETSTVLLVPTSEYPDGSFKCLHAHCAGRSMADVRERLGREVLQGLPAETKERLSKGAEQYIGEAVKPGNGSKVAPEVAKPMALVQVGGDWKEYLSYNLEEFVYISGSHKVAAITTRRVIPFTGWATSVQNQPGRELPVPEGSNAKPKVVKQDVLWKNHPHRRCCDHVVYDPSAPAIIEPEGITDWPRFNLYVPPRWASMLEASGGGGGAGLDQLDSGLWDAFLEHGEYLWEEEWPVALDWFAGRVQRPHARPKFALLHIAENQGLGRGWLKNVMVRLLGLDNVFSLSLGRAGGQFNGFVQSILTIVDEVYEEGTTAGEKKRIGSKLNDLITETYLTVERKGEELVPQEIFTGFWFMSNHFDALSLVRGDRRMHCTATYRKPMEAGYYDALYGLIGEKQGGGGGGGGRGGGIGTKDPAVSERYLRLYGELMRHEIKTNLAGRAPYTAFKDEMELASRSVLEEQIHKCLDVLLEMGIDIVDPMQIRMMIYRLYSTSEGYSRGGMPALNTIRQEANRVCRQRCEGPVLGKDNRVARRMKFGPFREKVMANGWIICPDATQGVSDSAQKRRAAQVDSWPEKRKHDEVVRILGLFEDKQDEITDAIISVGPV